LFGFPDHNGVAFWRLTFKRCALSQDVAHRTSSRQQQPGYRNQKSNK
jgi:hypothetical protein